MSSLDLGTMRSYLQRSISSINQNKLRGLLAEVDFRNHLAALGFSDRVSPGGWIARSDGTGSFAHDTIVLFPEVIIPSQPYNADRTIPPPSHGLHTICATFHQIGIRGYHCIPTISGANDAGSVSWQIIQLGLPTQQRYQQFPSSLVGFRPRVRKHNFLRYNKDVTSIPSQFVPEEFTKENLRVSFQSAFMSEISDVDGIFWGNQYTYPVEIKEKTCAHDRGMGDFFGLDVGPFVKLAFYAAKRGNLHSLFVVREIDHPESRGLVQWWAITFDRLAQFASWVPIGGGKNMGGGSSSVIKVPKCEFSVLDRSFLSSL